MNNWNIANLRKLLAQSQTLSIKELALMYGVSEATMTKKVMKEAPRVVGNCDKKYGRA